MEKCELRPDRDAWSETRMQNNPFEVSSLTSAVYFTSAIISSLPRAGTARTGGAGTTRQRRPVRGMAVLWLEQRPLFK